MKTLVLMLSTVLYFSTTNPIKAADKPLLWEVGETLTYKVNWSFFRLGTLKLTVEDTTRINNHRVYQVRLNIDSNPVLFFVNVHSEIQTFFDDDLNTHLFISTEEMDDITYNTRYQYNYEDSILSIDLTDEEDPDNRIHKQRKFTGQSLDGTSLIYYARFHSGKTRIDTVYYLFSGEPNAAIIEFEGESKSFKVDGIEEPLDTYYLEGNIPGKGISGLKGKFKGWFSRLGSKPPLKAELKVFIGHVSLTLESWENCVFYPVGEKTRNN